MSPFALFLRTFIKHVSKFGRYTDLIAGVVLVGLAFYWKSPWTGFFGVVSLVAAAGDLNGRIQRWSQRKAMNLAQARNARGGRTA